MWHFGVIPNIHCFSGRSGILVTYLCLYLDLNTFYNKNDQKCHNICYFFVKNNIDLLKFSLKKTNEFQYRILPSLMMFYLLQDYVRYIRFLHTRKSHAQNGRSDSTPRILTLSKSLATDWWETFFIRCFFVGISFLSPLFYG